MKWLHQISWYVMLGGGIFLLKEGSYVLGPLMIILGINGFIASLRSFFKTSRP